MEFYIKTHHLSKNEKRHLGKRLCSRLDVLRNKLKDVRSLEELIAVIPLIYSDLLKDIYSYYSTTKIHQDRLADLQFQSDILHRTIRFISQEQMEYKFKELTDNIEFSQKNIAKLWSFVGDICFFLSTENKKFDPFMYNLNLKLREGKEHPRYTEDRFVTFF